MEKDKLLHKIALLESEADHLLKEMEVLNELLVQVGFPKGLESVKDVAIDILESDDE